MRSRSRGFAIAALAACCATGCGARSSLETATGAGGASTSSASSAGSGAGGSGGAAPKPCNTLTQFLPVATLEGEAGAGGDHRLRLAVASDGQLVGATFARDTPSESTERHAGFSPWAAWPAGGTIGPVHRAASGFVSAGPFVSSSQGNTVAELLDGPMRLLAEVDPNQDGDGHAAPIEIPGYDAVFVACRANGASGPAHLVATTGDYTTTTAYVVDQHGVLAQTVLGCAGGVGVAPYAGAVVHGDGWIAAAATGKPLGGCTMTSNLNRPRRIDVFRIGADGTSKRIATIDSGFVRQLAVTPHPDGAYVVWTEHEHGESGALHAARIDASAGLVVDVSVDGGGLSSFASDTLGQRLVIASGNAPAVMTLSVYDESLTLVSSQVIEMADDGALAGPSTVLASPNGDGVLVGWTREVEPWTVQVTRFDCGP